MSHLKRVLEKRSIEHKESVAKWNKDHPGVPPGWNSNRTWKTISKIRRPSKRYREGWERIFLGKKYDDGDD